MEELGLFVLEKKKKRILIAKSLSYEKGTRFVWPIIFLNYYLKGNIFSLKKIQMIANSFLSNGDNRASLVAQWLRVCLPMQGTRVRALVWEDPTCRRATRPVSHNY